MSYPSLLNESSDAIYLITSGECQRLTIMGVINTIVFVGSLVFNSSLLWLFLSHKDLQNALNIFIMVLTFFNLTGSVLEYPFVILSQFHCRLVKFCLFSLEKTKIKVYYYLRWIFRESGCAFSGFIMYFVGCTSIYLIVAISIERYQLNFIKTNLITSINLNCLKRYFAVRSTLFKRVLTKSKCYIIAFFCIMFGFIWAFLPMIGWSSYILEKAHTTCSINLYDRSVSGFSYSIAMFVFVYFGPLSVIIYTNTSLIIMVMHIEICLL